MVMEKKKVLYFIEGSVPTEEDYTAAQKLGTAMFRNALFCVPGEPIETADAIAGSVPDSYREAYKGRILGAAKVKAEVKSDPVAPTSGDKTPANAPPPPPPPAK